MRKNLRKRIMLANLTCDVLKTLGMDYPLKSESPGHNCLECGNQLPYNARHGKKFCSISCKNRFHNRQQMGPRTMKVRILAILEKNHRILSELLEDDITSVPMSNLLVLGFNPMYATCCYRLNRREMRMCFDIRFCMTASRIYDLAYTADLTAPVSM